MAASNIRQSQESGFRISQKLKATLGRWPEKKSISCCWKLALFILSIFLFLLFGLLFPLFLFPFIGVVFLTGSFFILCHNSLFIRLLCLKIVEIVVAYLLVEEILT